MNQVMNHELYHCSMRTARSPGIVLVAWLPCGDIRERLRPDRVSGLRPISQGPLMSPGPPALPHAERAMALRLSGSGSLSCTVPHTRLTFNEIFHEIIPLSVISDSSFSFLLPSISSPSPSSLSIPLLRCPLICSLLLYLFVLFHSPVSRSCLFSLVSSFFCLYCLLSRLSLSL